MKCHLLFEGELQMVDVVTKLFPAFYIVFKSETKRGEVWGVWLL